MTGANALNGQKNHRQTGIRGTFWIVSGPDPSVKRVEELREADDFNLSAEILLSVSSECADWFKVDD